MTRALGHWFRAVARSAPKGTPGHYLLRCAVCGYGVHEGGLIETPCPFKP